MTLGGDGGRGRRAGNHVTCWKLEPFLTRDLTRDLIRDLTRDLTRGLAWTGGHVTLGGDGGVVIEPGNASRVRNWSHSWGVHRRH